MQTCGFEAGGGGWQRFAGRLVSLEVRNLDDGELEFLIGTGYDGIVPTPGLALRRAQESKMLTLSRPTVGALFLFATLPESGDAPAPWGVPWCCLWPLLKHHSALSALLFHAQLRMRHANRPIGG